MKKQKSIQFRILFLNYELRKLFKYTGGSDIIKFKVDSGYKNQLIDDVSKLYQAGCRQFAENRVQELLKKKEQLPKDVQWHLIGSLQK